MSYKAYSLTTQYTKIYFRVDEIARYFSISKRTIYRLVEDEDLKGVRIRKAIRIHRNDLERYERRIRREKCVW
jgi:excisionase family DNA binding protein